MDIAALSMSMAQVNVKQQVGVSLTKGILETAEVQTDELLKMMEQSVTPELGGTIDVKL